MKSVRTIVWFVVIFFVSFNKANLQVGRECQLNESGLNGVCQYLKNCYAAQYIKKPTICTYDVHNAIVCCPTSVPNRLMSDLKPLPVRKCEQYSKYVYKNTTIVLPGHKDFNKIDRCGQKDNTLLISEVTTAAPREFPHSAIIGYQNLNGSITWNCSGSLVSSRYVLTAAHCLDREVLYVPSIVRLGQQNLNDGTVEANLIDMVIDIIIERIIPHPEYKWSTGYNDIALLKLAHKVRLSEFIRPICLPTVDENPNKAIASGWRATEFDGIMRIHYQISKYFLQTYTNEECNSFYNNTKNKKFSKGIIDTQFCAGHSIESKDMCQGDSGGPLQIVNTDYYCTYKQIGITSDDVVCDRINPPAVYTRVFKYVNWISGIIWAPREDE